MSVDVENWSYDDFIAFVLLHVAKSDFSVSMEENEMLENLISNQRLKELMKLHKLNSDYDNIQIIIKLGGIYCPTDAEKQVVMAKVMEMIMADGEFNFYEKNAQRSLELLLSN